MNNMNRMTEDHLDPDRHGDNAYAEDFCDECGEHLDDCCCEEELEEDDETKE